MKRYNILVTAVGSVVGYGIIEALRKSGYDPYIVGCDIYDDAVGQYFADDFVVACPAANKEYKDFLKNLIDKENIDMVLFGIEQEISAVYENYTAFSKYLDKLIINSKDIYELCNDKWLTYSWLKENNLCAYAIDSVIEGSFADIKSNFGDKFLIKPRVSRGGKGIVEVCDEEDFTYYRKKLNENFMAQRIVGDIENEYTVGIFGLGNGQYVNSIYLRRKLSQEGATSKAWVVEDADLVKATEEITEVLCPEGPTNYQFRKEGNSVYLLEINPRISSSVSIRSSFSYNEAKMCIEYYLEGKTPSKVTVKKGKAIRYIKDWITII